tara:strand:- start:654 stop:878 length:225 start_codon:yes stop_codon:yes gene_type:complete
VPQKRYVKKIKTNFSEICLMCKDRLKGVGYEYQPQQYVADYIPPKLITCKKCIYREYFGSKNYRKKMKEGVLDG